MPLRHKHQVTLVFILLVAAFLRIVGFVTTSPPGPEHDEVANWLIDKAILAGQHGVYFTDAYGHEAGFHYWQTLFVWLVGDNLVALRTPAALMGVLAVAVTYALNRRLFGREFAIFVTAIIAVLFMPIFYSRLALRAISLPVTAGVAACFMWDWLKSIVNGQQPVNSDGPSATDYRSLLWAAMFAGLSSYTYLASRALPIFFIGFIVYIAIFHRSLFKSTWQNWLWFAAVYLLISLPLILFLQNPQNIEIRTGEVDGPMRALFAGNFRPVLQNSFAILSGFGFSGDPLWRQGVAFKPIFEPIFATFFYLGLLISLWRIRDLRYGFLLIWLGASVVPSIVTVDAPSTIRMILMLPVTASFPIVVLEQLLLFFGFSISRTPVIGNRGVVHSYPQLSPGNSELSTRKMSFTLILVLTSGILLFYGVRSSRHLWITWPNNDEVRFVWQESLTEIGRHIDQQAQSTSIKHSAIAGWSPDTMDDPTLELVVKDDTVVRRHFGRVGEIQTLVIPNAPDNRYAIYRPNDLPFNFQINQDLTGWHASETIGGFTVYTPISQIEGMLIYAEPKNVFTDSATGNELIYLGSSPIEKSHPQLEFLTYWKVGDFSDKSRPNTKVFVHLVDAEGNLLAQHDGLDAPHYFWQTGDRIIQFHSLENIDSAAELRVGVYVGAEPWPRFITEANSDFINIPLQE